MKLRAEKGSLAAPFSYAAPPKRGPIEATFGYAITCHKSQGSQWDHVIVWDEKLGQTKRDRAEWLYTAITRAAEGLVIVD